MSLSESVVDEIFGEKCSSCGKRELVSGYYSRAFNSDCRQAAGDHGMYCMNCKEIHFDIPDFAEWLARQPKWVVPYGATQEQGK